MHPKSLYAISAPMEKKKKPKKNRSTPEALLSLFWFLSGDKNIKIGLII